MQQRGDAQLLSVGPTGRYLVDPGGRPIFVNGDTAWSLPAAVLPAEAERYFADREAKGFNAVIVNGLEHLFAPAPPRTPDGIEPFLAPGDLARPNDAYFERLDEILSLAAMHGITLFLAPLYLGYIDPHYPGFGFTGLAEGWHAEMVAAGVDSCRAYGRFLGRRWRDADNLVWVIGGDRNPGDVREHVLALVDGIRQEDERHLMTAHVHPDDSAVEQYGGAEWLTVNQTYTYQIVHRKLAADYRRLPVRPFVLFESTYEGEHNSSDLQIRRQAWWAVTSGAAGTFLGNFPLWLMAPGWPGVLDSPGAIAMSHLGQFVRSIAWWDLVPDEDQRVVVAGLGELNGLDRATAAATPDGRLALVYVPGPRTVTVNLGELGGWAVRARWFDPRTASWHHAGVLTRQGYAQFAAPWAEDAVLLLEDVAGGEHGVWPRS